MTHRIIATSNAPEAIGPYSQGVAAGELLFVSGQIALNPATGKMVPGGIKEQTEQVLKNVLSIIEAAGGSLEKVVKCTVYLADMNDFNDMNHVYANYFRVNPPARAAVQVARLPRDARVEIDAIVHLKS